MFLSPLVVLNAAEEEVAISARSWEEGGGRGGAGRAVTSGHVPSRALASHVAARRVH